MKLNNLKIGQSGKVIDMNGLPHKTQKKLMSLGILPNTIIKLVRFAPFGDPMQVEIYTANLAIRIAIANQINIELINHD